MTTFEKLIAPLKAFFNEQGNQIDEKSGSKSLFFGDFTLKIVYAIISGLPSMRMLLSDLETNPKAISLGLKPTPYSTFRDGFSRFSVHCFKEMFLYVLKSYDWMRIQAVDELGIVKLVDGSLFPTLKSMYWASYKKSKNAIRLHLALDLNTMVTTEFIAQKANSSERAFLLSILEKGVTYVADRGYFSFELGNSIKKAEAFFLIRLKGNMKFKCVEMMQATSSRQLFPDCFRNITDQIIRFDNDGFGHDYRLVCFSVLQSQFMICTNRSDLTTLEIIMLYAYRWQVELLFKFLKRTMNAIHLFNHSENGANIQFYLFLITAMLQLRLRQVCQKETLRVIEQKKALEQINQYFGESPDKWIQSIAMPFYQHWKIGAHWLLALRNLIDHIFDDYVIDKLAN